jgi:hypothetical protein
MKIKRQKCGAYFRGIDGLGTCDTKCQWYRLKLLCPNSEEAIRKDKIKEILKKMVDGICAGYECPYSRINIRTYEEENYEWATEQLLGLFEKMS